MVRFVADQACRYKDVGNDNLAVVQMANGLIRAHLCRSVRLEFLIARGSFLRYAAYICVCMVSKLRRRMVREYGTLKLNHLGP